MKHSTSTHYVKTNDEEINVTVDEVLLFTNGPVNLFIEVTSKERFGDRFREHVVCCDAQARA